MNQVNQVKQLYAVICGVHDINGTKGYSLAIVNPMTNKTKYAGVFNEATLIRNLNQNYKLINFGVKNGRIVECCGSFDRLKASGGTQPLIVLQEVSNTKGLIVGYVVLNPKTGALVYLQKESILEKAQESEIPVLQNAVIRGNKINCFPNHPFPKRVVNTKARNTKERDLKAQKSRPATAVNTPYSVERIARGIERDPQPMPMDEFDKLVEGCVNKFVSVRKNDNDMVGHLYSRDTTEIFCNILDWFAKFDKYDAKLVFRFCKALREKSDINDSLMCGGKPLYNIKTEAFDAFCSKYCDFILESEDCLQ